jgi:hypothetical protein
VKKKSDLFLGINLVTDCSHLFVFAAWDTTLQTALMFDLTNTIRDMKKKVKLPSNAFKQLSAKDAEENFNHA